MTRRYEVEIRDSNGARMLTPHVSGLVIDSVDPGGYAGGTFELDRSVNAPDFEADAEVLFWNTETGTQRGGGVILDPGRDISARGEKWQVQVTGAGLAEMQARHVPYCIIDTRIDAWIPGKTTNARLTWSSGTQPGGDEGQREGWTFTIAPGALNDGYIGRLNYYLFEQFEDIESPYRVEVGGYCYRHIAGNGNGPDNKIESLVATQNGSLNQTTIDTNGFDTVEHVRRRGIGTHWDEDGIGTGNNQPVHDVTLRYRRINNAPAPGVGGDDDWVHVWDMRVSALRLDRNREPITAAGTYDADPRSDYVLAHEALIDCWARFCPNLDLENARIDETSTFQHRDLVWTEGVTPAEVLGKLMELDPAFTWAVWEKQPNGLNRAEWRQRETDVRYEILDYTSFSQPGSAVTALDLVHVIGEAPNGEYLAYTPPSTTGSDLRSKTIKIDEKMERTDFDAAAAKLAQSEIERSQLQASSARITFNGKVFDHQRGCLVDPDEVLPGYLLRVPRVRAQVDTLNPRENDGASIYRGVSNRYDVDAGEATMELDAYTVDEAEAIASLMSARGAA